MNSNIVKWLRMRDFSYIFSKHSQLLCIISIIDLLLLLHCLLSSPHSSPFSSSRSVLSPPLHSQQWPNLSTWVVCSLKPIVWNSRREPPPPHLLKFLAPFFTLLGAGMWSRWSNVNGSILIMSEWKGIFALTTLFNSAALGRARDLRHHLHHLSRQLPDRRWWHSRLTGSFTPRHIVLLIHTCFNVDCFIAMPLNYCN